MPAFAGGGSGWNRTSALPLRIRRSAPGRMIRHPCRALLVFPSRQDRKGGIHAAGLDYSPALYRGTELNRLPAEWSPDGCTLAISVPSSLPLFR